MKAIKKGLLIIGALAVTFHSGCIKSMLPVAQNYPFEDASVVTARADELSADMTAYIRDWKAGRVSSSLPRSVLPEGIFYDEMSSDENAASTEYVDPQIVDPTTMNASEYICTRPAYAIDWNKVLGLYADPHCCYIIPTTHIAPFGSKTVIKGKFPYSRYFSIQPCGPFDATVYYYQCVGLGEVPLLDADIVPDSGSINPFKVGANRLATNRSYTVTVQNTKGKWMSLMPNVKPPYYRTESNMRYGSGINYMGPGMYGKSTGIGRLYAGQIWMRYYGIDKNKDNIGGVPLPTMYSQLSTGEVFLIKTDVATKLKICNKNCVAISTAGADPTDLSVAGSIAWRKNFGVAIGGMETVHIGQGWATAEDKKYIRDYILGLSGKGWNQPEPRNWELDASLCSSISYLISGVSLNAGKVYVLSGTMPTFPATRNGNSTMTAANMRYMSFTTYWDNINLLGGDPTQPSGNAMTSIMDEDIVLNSSRKYVICYSRATEKPTNATSSAGVTWVNFGPVSTQGLFLRWLSVGPEWSFSKTPHEVNLPWKTVGWSSEYYNNNIIGNRAHDGFLGIYKPKAYYINKSDFEACGSSVTEAKLDAYKWGGGAGSGMPNPGSNWTKVWETTSANGSDANINLSGVSGRYVMIECLTRNSGKDSYQIDELRIFDTDSKATNRALRCAAYASSQYGSEDPSRAVDGDRVTAWNSATGTATAWIYVDLGAVYPIEFINIEWPSGGEYAKSYNIKVSNDPYGDGGSDNPPAQVTGLTATVASDTQINLSWTACGESDFNHYNIYRNGSLLATTTNTSYSNTGLSTCTTYQYEVAAVDNASQEGAKSIQVSATTTGCGGGSSGWSDVWSTTTATGADVSINLTGASGRYVMIECLERNAGKDSYQIDEIKIFDTDSRTTNRALNRMILASSQFGEECPSRAVDNNSGTAWNSATGSTTAWIYVDLGAVYPIELIDIEWPAGGEYAKSYKIKVAQSLPWSEVWSTNSATGADVNINLTGVSGRYVMIECLERNAGKDSYQIDELRIFSTDSQTTNIALNKYAMASSQFGGESASRAVDGNGSNAWNSATGSALACIYVDLGAVYPIEFINIQWPAGGEFAKSYNIKVTDILP